MKQRSPLDATAVSVDVIRTAHVLVLGGLFVCAAIVAAFARLGWRALSGGPPLENHDYVAGAIFVGVAGVGLAVSLRTTWRLWRHGATATDLAPTLARATPLLVIAGGVAGAFVGASIEHRHEASLESDIQSWCDEHAEFGFDDVDTCVAAGISCLHESWVNAASWQAKADDIATALQAKRAALMAVEKKEYEHIEQVNRLDRRLSTLEIRARTENRDAARRAGIACTAAAAPAR